MLSGGFAGAGYSVSLIFTTYGSGTSPISRPTPTWISGQVRLFFIFPLRVPSVDVTATHGLSVPGSWRRVLTPCSSFSRASGDTNIRVHEAAAFPVLPQFSRPQYGSGWETAAVGSPQTAHTWTPLWSTISARRPKNRGSHNTRSASFPASMEPT